MLKSINKFGDVLFVSDNIGDYDEKQIEEVKKAFAQSGARIISVEYIDKDNLEIIYQEGKNIFNWRINLKSGENEVKSIS